MTFTTSSEKFTADSVGNETAAELHDYIDVGVFADNNGASPGKPLTTKRVKITKSKNVYTFTVSQKPDRVGIDPYNLLVDRLPEDNVKAVSERTSDALSSGTPQRLSQ